MRSFYHFILFLLVIIASIQVVEAQFKMRITDFSKISIDALSDEEILKLRDQLLSSGLTEVQAEQLAIQRGMPGSEIIKLRARIGEMQNATKSSPVAKLTSLRNTDSGVIRRDGADSSYITNILQQKRYVFGSELFANTSMTFEPNLRIATPQSYVLGADDELLIDVFGYQEVNYRLTVSPEGSITIPYVGVIPVAGNSIEQVTGRIKQRMIRNGYNSLASGQSKLEVNIGKIKSIKVTIVGQAKRPGTYTVSSLSNIFNALYAAGGINENGSFRTIELIRNNKVIKKLDAYDFLLKGDLTNNVGLMDQDVIRIPVAQLQVEVMGEVKRPAIFEIVDGENMNNVIRFAGGFTNQAYTASIKVEQLNDRERQLKDVAKSAFDSYQPERGDKVLVEKILETFSNRVTISGAVMRPGDFELSQGLTLSQLIKRADGLREDAFTNRALLVRQKADLTREVIPFDVNEIKQNAAYDIVLQKEDEVTIASIFDYRDNYTVVIEGEVRKPGVYTYFDNMTLKDLLFQSGGLSDAASAKQIEIARRINNDTLTSTANIAQVLDVQSEKDLIIRGAEIKLSPWDIVLIRTKLGYKPQTAVRLDGEVLYPGNYVLATRQDRISDLVRRAGGLTPEAFYEGAYLSRVNISGIAKEANISRIQKIQRDIKDTSGTLLEDVTKPTVKVGLDLRKILDNPGSPEDIVLREGDALTVSKKTNEVMVNGEVMFPTQVVFKEGADMDYYIGKAGGFTDNARKKRTFVLYANGSAGKTKKFLFVKNYPEVRPGAEILVPKAADRVSRRLSTAEVLGLTTGFATLLTLAVTLISIK